MSGDTASLPTTEWTWADIVSTYRFWGLLLFYCLSAAATFTCWTFLPVYLADQMHRSRTEIGWIFSLRGFGFFLGGFYLAWAVGRRKSVNWLLFAGALQLLGFLLLVVSGLSVLPLAPLVGALLLGVGGSAILVSIAALLAGGRSGPESLAIAFGVIVGAAELMRLLTPPLITPLLDKLGFGGVAAAGAILLVLALLALAFVDRSLFEGTPPERGKSIVPCHRHPALVGVLALLVPFYYLYWLYKAHGEIASLIPSRALMSPRGAVGLGLVPFLIPVMMTTLTDHLNRRATAQGAGNLSRPWATFLWSVLLPPVAMALVQSRINTSASATGQVAPAA